MKRGLTPYIDLPKRWWLGRVVRTTRAFINPNTTNELPIGSMCQVLYKGQGRDHVSVGIPGLDLPLDALEWWPRTDRGRPV